MKKLSLTILVASALVLSSCGSLPGSASNVLNAGQKLQAVAQVAEKVDFKSGEALCSDGDGNDATDMGYKVGKVVTPATPATKNQAEVLFVENGAKAWSSFVIPSHKASNAELTVGKLVFVPAGWADYEAKDVSVENYRQSRWSLERITSVDELFKKRIEVGGNKYHPELVRIPEVPLE